MCFPWVFKCLHAPTNHVYISRDVVFDENVFPFHALPNNSITPLPDVSSTTPLPGQFVDVAHAPVLLPNHAAGVGCGARLELLEEQAPTDALDLDVGLLHGHAYRAAPINPRELHLQPPRGHRPRLPRARASPASTSVVASPGPAASSPGPGTASLAPGPATDGPASQGPTPPASPLPAGSGASPGGSASPLSSPASGGSSSPLSSPESSPALQPPAAAPRPRTRSQTGVFQPKIRTDGTVVWLAACMAHAAEDPTAEPRHFQDALSIPHWRAVMEQGFQALLKNDTWQLVPPVSGSTSLILNGCLKSRDMLMAPLNATKHG